MTNFEQIYNWLEKSESIVILTGAGMGIDSGLAAYRGSSGQWGQVEADTHLTAIEVVTPEYLSKNTKYVWKMFAQRMSEYKTTKPHYGFDILKKWINDFELDYFILTSNVDEQFIKAGFDRQKHRELHGSIFYMQCSKPCSQNVWRYNFDIKELMAGIETGNYPQCPACGCLARPNVYMFRDGTYISARSDEQNTRFQEFLAQNAENEMVAFEIGSGPHVQSIRKKTRMLGTKYGAKVVRINPKDFRIRAPHIGIAKGALESLTQIDAFIQTKI